MSPMKFIPKYNLLFYLAEFKKDSKTKFHMPFYKLLEIFIRTSNSKFSCRKGSSYIHGGFKYRGGNNASGWPCHAIEHALSAFYDITHGEGLAIIIPRCMKHILSDRTLDRFVKYGINVFGIDASLDKWEIAEKAIEETYRFFESIGIPMHLRKVGIDESRVSEMAHHIAVNEGLDQAYVPLTEEATEKIIRESL